MAKRVPTVYYSLRSPYSWLSLARLKDLGWRDQFRYVPFWDPGPEVTARLEADGRQIAYRPMSRPKHLYILQDVKRLAAREHRPFAWPLDREGMDWDLSHLALLKVAVAGGDLWGLYDALIEARWGRGEDICTDAIAPTVLAPFGLGSATSAALRADEALVTAAAAALGEAWDNDVFGVPYFKVGHQRFWGFDRLPLFLQEVGLADAGAVDPWADVPAPVLDSPPGTYALDHPGGCG